MAYKIIKGRRCLPVIEDITVFPYCTLLYLKSMNYRLEEKLHVNLCDSQKLYVTQNIMENVKNMLKYHVKIKYR